MKKDQGGSVSQFHRNAGLVDAGKIVKTATDAVAANVQPLMPLTARNYEKVGNVQMPTMPKTPDLSGLGSRITKTVQDGLKSAGVGQGSAMANTALSGAPRAPRTPRAPRMPRTPRAPRA